MAENKKPDYAALKAGGFMRQMQKDNFSLRLRVVGGNLTAQQLATVTAVAEKYGKGYVHLTSRQGVEIPFIQLKDIDAVKEALAEGGVQPGVCGPRVRTVTACQGGVCCPSGCINALEVAEKLDERYFGRQLPHKFKFGVTGCQNNCLKAEENDFGVKGGLVPSYEEDSCIHCGVCAKVCRLQAITFTDGKVEYDASKCNYCGRCVKSCPVDAWKGESGYIVSFGGTFGNSIQKGQELLPIITDEDAMLRVADAAIDFFDRNANRGERFAKTIERVGWDELKKTVEEAYHG
ncbi:MAG: 4Fe-4S binding protein [Oscillospiraceae bacterium]|nr:4Fe-4S binding protein [Oscillospiraceae bacterium]